MTHDELMNEWELDCEIDENHLDQEAIRSAKLHSKYLRLLFSYRTKIAALQNEYNTMRQVKFRYYRGELNRDELDNYGWKQWQGTKPIKSEAEELLAGDTDLNRIRVKIEYIKVLSDTIESIMKEISNRQWLIRNAIEYKKFIAGV